MSGQASAIRGRVNVDAVHDMRTATRRLRTAITIFGADAGRRDRRAAERELRRAARDLGAVRDLDVLLGALDAAAGGDRRGRRALRPLRRAWKRERRAAASRLKTTVRSRRFERSLDRARRLADDGGHSGGSARPVDRVSTRAPAVVWEAFGALLAHDVDALEAEPDAIHRMRIAAKKLRYALEGFEDAMSPGPTLVAQVTAVQDAAGDMHDAVVAAGRARSTLDRRTLRRRERRAIEAFARAQDRRATGLRPVVAASLAVVRGRAFRESVSGALAGMGHVTPGR